MALVAGYGSSDDEDDGDEVISIVPQKNSATTTPTADEPPEARNDLTLNASSGPLRLPPPVVTAEKASEEALEDFVKLKSYGNATSDTAQPRPPKNALKLPPPKYTKERQTVKITVPALSSYDSDEDDGPSAKKPKATAASGASGLLSALPPPRNTTVKDLIPHSLSKPAPPAPKRPAAQQAPASAVKRLPSAAASAASSGSRDDDDGGSEGPADFFSLESAPRSANYGSGHASGSAGSLWSSASSSLSGHLQAPSAALGSQSSEVYGGYNDVSTSPAGLQHGAFSADNYSAATYTYEAEHEATADGSAATPSGMLADEQFLRLQGKKQRGKEEINIVDVSEDNFRASQLELTKTLSQEVDPRSFSHRKKGEGPSTQEKRKHQITYLAFQAKERELELKNAWAANRVTRQQTQSKYGF